MFRLRNRRPNPTRTYNRARHRLARADVLQVIDWADVAGTELVQALNVYRHQRGTETVAEITRAAHTLAAVADELADRAHGKTR